MRGGCSICRNSVVITYGRRTSLITQTFVWTRCSLRLSCST